MDTEKKIGEYSTKPLVDSQSVEPILVKIIKDKEMSKLSIFWDWSKGQILTIIFLPLTVYLTIMLTENAKRPQVIIDTVQHEVYDGNGLKLKFFLINNSSFDGLIYKDALLKFDNKTIPLTSDSGNVSIKAFSEARITFLSPAFNDNQFYRPIDTSNVWTIDQKKFPEKNDVIEFTKLMNDKKEIPVEIILKVNNKDLEKWKDTLNTKISE